LLTGLHTGHARIRGNGDHPLLPEDFTIGELLGAAGYATAAIGKWGLGTADTTGRPDQQGFDESFGFLDHTHAHRQYTDHLWKNGEVFRVDLEKDYVNDLFAQAAVEFVERNARRPFFLYLSFTVPHAELRVPDESLRPYRSQFPEKPFVNAKADAVPTHPPSRVRRPTIGYRSQPEPFAAFAGMIARMDQHVGQLLAALRERGIERDTLVLFTSDNGPHKEGGADPELFDSNGPLRGIKRDLYEGGIRVPMLARWPGAIPRGSVSHHVWAFWDVLPTLAEVAGVAPPSGLDGRSALAALRGREVQPAEFLYWEFHEGGFHQAVRTGRWKAVRHGLDAPLELYDLEDDLGETRDVAARRPEVVARIEEYLKGARTESADFPVRGG
jgi:arylsulfatase A-like enzyme